MNFTWHGGGFNIAPFLPWTCAIGVLLLGAVLAYWSWDVGREQRRQQNRRTWYEFDEHGRMTRHDPKDPDAPQS